MGALHEVADWKRNIRLVDGKPNRPLRCTLQAAACTCSRYLPRFMQWGSKKRAAECVPPRRLLVFLGIREEAPRPRVPPLPCLRPYAALR